MLSSLWLPTTLFLFPYISSVRPFHFLPILGFLLIIQVYIAILSTSIPSHRDLLSVYLVLHYHPSSAVINVC